MVGFLGHVKEHLASKGSSVGQPNAAQELLFSILGDSKPGPIAGGMPISVIMGCKPKTVVLAAEESKNPARPNERKGRGVSNAVYKKMVNDRRRHEMGRAHGPFTSPVKVKRSRR